MTARVTLHDVAREVGVHPSTVSRALDPVRAELVKESTRSRIIEVAERLGYRPHMIARGLQTGRTLTVGVIVADLGNTFVTPIIHGLTAALEIEGMMPVIAETEDDHTRFSKILDHMLGRRVDAIISVATRAGDREILESAGRIVPVVIAARPLAHTRLPQAVHDDRAGARLVAEHLAELGHRRVIQLRGPLDVENFARRAEGFSETIRRAGVIEVTFDPFAARPIMDEGARLMRRLVDEGELPSGIFVHNDLMAVGALSVLRERGIRVPQDVSVAGYNDLQMMGFVDPPLTTVRYPGLEVGRVAGEMARRLISGEAAENVTIDAELIVRASTSRVGAGTD